MNIYSILITIGSILFISSIYLWFRAGVIRRRNNDESKKNDRTGGGFMFMTSLLIFAIALLIWLLT